MLREVLYNDWYTTIIVSSLTIIVGAKLLNFNRFRDILRLIGNFNYLKIYFKDHKFLDLFDIVLFLNFCINGALISILTYSHFVQKIDLNSEMFIKIAVLLGSGVLLKILLELSIGYVFDIKKLFHSYAFQQVSFLNFLGVVLLPLNSLVIFGAPNNQTLLVLILIISGVVLSIGLVKSIKFNISPGVL